MRRELRGRGEEGREGRRAGGSRAWRPRALSPSRQRRRPLSPPCHRHPAAHHPCIGLAVYGARECLRDEVQARDALGDRRSRRPAFLLFLSLLLLLLWLLPHASPYLFFSCEPPYLNHTYYHQPLAINWNCHSRPQALYYNSKWTFEAPPLLLGRRPMGQYRSSSSSLSRTPSIWERPTSHVAVGVAAPLRCFAAAARFPVARYKRHARSRLPRHPARLQYAGYALRLLISA